MHTPPIDLALIRAEEHHPTPTAPCPLVEPHLAAPVAPKVEVLPPEVAHDQPEPDVIPRQRQRRLDERVGQASPSRGALVHEPDAVVALGDVHGDYRALCAALVAAGLLDVETGGWCGGDTVLVQLGDILDRGDSESECWELMQRLNPGDPAMANSRGETPIELAVRQGAEELVVHLLDWDSDMQQRASNTGQLGADGELGASSTNELSSLSNLYNLHSGDTPALASLREGARFLRLVGNCNSSVQNEHALMDQLMVTQKLVQHAHTNPYQSTISLANTGLAAAAAGGSGASLLLFLLATSDGIERRMSFSDVTANRREVLQEALELANNLAFQVIDKVERGKRVDELQNLLFVLLPGSAWRIFDSTGKIRCLTLMLSGSRQQLVEHERVQEAIQLAWSSSSRFAFLLSSGFFCCIVISLSFAGWDGLNSPELRTSVEGALGLPLEATTTPTFWFDWLRNTVLPQAIMSHRDLGLNSARFDAELAHEALEL